MFLLCLTEIEPGPNTSVYCLQKVFERCRILYDTRQRISGLHIITFSFLTFIYAKKFFSFTSTKLEKVKNLSIFDKILIDLILAFKILVLCVVKWVCMVTMLYEYTWLCMYVIVYVRTWFCISARDCVCLYVIVYVSTWLCAYVRDCVCMYMIVYVCTWVCACVYVFVWLRACIFVCALYNTYTNSFVYMRISRT